MNRSIETELKKNLIRAFDASDASQPTHDRTCGESPTPPTMKVEKRDFHGKNSSALSWLTALLAEQRRSAVVLVADNVNHAEALHRELFFFHQSRRVELLTFPAWEVLPFEQLSPFAPLVSERITTLFRLIQMAGANLNAAPLTIDRDVGVVIVTTPAALMQRLPPRSALTGRGFTVSTGDRMDLPAFRGFLVQTGYRQAAQVEEPGEFSVRGGILDLFPPGEEEPVRMELFGDEVERIHQFDTVTQRSMDPLPCIRALPVCEVILTQETIQRFRIQYRELRHFENNTDTLYQTVSEGRRAQGMEHYLPLFYPTLETFCDYLPDETLFLTSQSVRTAATNYAQEIQDRFHEERNHPVLSPEQLYLDLSGFMREINRFEALSTEFEQRMGFTPIEIEIGKETGTEAVQEQLVTWIEEKESCWRICLVMLTVGQRERIREILEQRGITTVDANRWSEALSLPITSQIILMLGDISNGFMHSKASLIVISEEEIFGTRVRRGHTTDRRYLDQIIAGFSNLQEGHPVVHVDYGIGRYGGLQSMAVQEIQNDFLLISYHNDDKLYVPVENLDLVSKHPGGDGVVLDKLGSSRWHRTRKRVQQDLFEIAEELVALQAQRQTGKGVAFPRPDALFQNFSSTFPFEETPDQEQAIKAVLADMAAPRPMDRLICGDVGFGKTEVAMRAAFMAVMHGKQVALLTPTTILAQQHYESFSKRFAPYPIIVELISRFRSAKKQRELLTATTEGNVDILIGTHKLLQKDVAFKDLGLIIVDEEQRFGVTHKERLKHFRATADLLTLTATPIPRTLHMSLSGVRDISIIATPPSNRLPIRTIVTPYRRSQIREAILREIYRNGQVFYLYNKVEDIEQTAREIATLVPEATVGTAHGQMRANRLEKIMASFYHQEFNVLVCTTIIENGVDIPSANTIIIHRADLFGLAQLHQLRGRVGRSKHRAYAYLLIPPPERLTQEASKRLEAIKTLVDLGSGFLLATHDLEIRGAGNLLGAKQSGQIREVGFALYNQMLKEAIQRIRSDTPFEDKTETQLKKQAKTTETPFVPTRIQLRLSTYIPESYIPDVHQRLALYKRIADLTTLEEIQEMRAEMVDRFGSYPEPVEHLFQVVAIKRLCARMKIVKLEAGPKGGKFQFDSEPVIDVSALLTLLRRNTGRMTFNQETQTLVIQDPLWREAAIRLKTVRKILRELSDPDCVQNCVQS